MKESFNTYEEKLGKEATDNNLKYFTDFGDPSVPEKTMGSTLHAMYHAIRKMKLSGIKVTATASVWKFMRKVPEKKPLALHLLNLVIFWELALVVCQYKRNNDADGFFNTPPLFLPLFASSVLFTQKFTIIMLSLMSQAASIRQDGKLVSRPFHVGCSCIDLFEGLLAVPCFVPPFRIHVFESIGRFVVPDHHLSKSTRIHSKLGDVEAIEFVNGSLLEWFQSFADEGMEFVVIKQNIWRKVLLVLMRPSCICSGSHRDCWDLDTLEHESSV